MKQTVAIGSGSDSGSGSGSGSGSDPPAPRCATQLSSTQETPAKGKESLAQDNARPQPRAMPSTVVVSFKDGLLSIVAQDVKLRDILEQVREATGAAVHAPALNELVTAHLGPRAPAQVIAALLKCRISRLGTG